ncbi:MAG: hypothetical protein KAT58_11580 [candidate division Zixibacteria bacterium]|nr:hypothetical protein [candidate division Zixibacteria bacterium]
MIELIIIIVVLGIITAVAIPKVGSMINSAKINQTKAEMAELKKSIIGNPQLVAGGAYVSPGFEGDIGYPPSRLEDLVTKPDSIAAWDHITGIGWHGPYVDSADGSYLLNAWDVAYIYDDNARTITSTGSGDNIVISF